MKLIERYIFKKVANAFVLGLVTLSVTVWLTQALRNFDLVSAMGQTIFTFFQITLLLLPALATVVAPVALLIAVIYTFTSLNDGSELVVINAAGTRRSTLLRPVLLVAIATSVLMASMTLYFSPLSLRIWRELITNVRGSVLTSILREGEFMHLASGLVFQLRSRGPEGTLRGIFLSDSRQPGEVVTYVAERGAVLDSPVGMFLVMRDGTIQRANQADDSIAIIQFSSYAFDLSSFSARADTQSFRPAERSTGYLLNPDPDDRLYQLEPEKYRAELHARLTTPLNALVLALLPLVFMAQAETTRQQRSATIGMIVIVAVAISVAEFALSGAAGSSLFATIALYCVPLLSIAISIYLILRGIQPRPPESLLIFSDRMAAGMRSMFRSRAAAAQRSRAA